VFNKTIICFLLLFQVAHSREYFIYLTESGLVQRKALIQNNFSTISTLKKLSPSKKSEIIFRSVYQTNKPILQNWIILEADENGQLIEDLKKIGRASCRERV